MTAEQRELDKEFLRQAGIMAEGVAVLQRRVSEAQVQVLQADYDRVKAILDNAPQRIRQARAAARSQALLVLREREEYYHDAIKENAAYLRRMAK